MYKSHLALLPVIKPVDLHITKWLIQIYIFIFHQNLKRCLGRLLMDSTMSKKKHVAYFECQG